MPVPRIAVRPRNRVILAVALVAVVAGRAGADDSGPSAPADRTNAKWADWFDEPTGDDGVLPFAPAESRAAVDRPAGDEPAVPAEEPAAPAPEKASTASGEAETPRTTDAGETPATASGPTPPPPTDAHASVPPGVGPAPTKAEQITRLRQTIESDERQLEELRAGMNDPASEYVQAETEFGEADATFQAGKKRIEELTAAGQADEAAALAKSFAEVEATWKLARERFDIAIQTRETVQAQIAALEQKVAQDRQALERLTDPETALETAGAPTNGPQPAAAVTAAGASAGPAAEAAPVTTAAAVMPAGSAPAAPATAGEASPAAPEATEAASDAEKPPSKELAHAQHNAAEKDRDAEAAEQQAESVAERLAVLDKNIELQQKLVQTARRRRDLANESRRALEKEYKAKSLAGASADELRALDDKIRDAERRFEEAIAEAREGAESLDAMQSERAALQAEELAAVKLAAEKRKEADDAKGLVEELQNPFTPRNVLQWCIDHAPRLLAIVVGMLLLQLVARVFSRRIVMILARKGARGSKEEREDRAKTLVGVFHNTASLVIFVGSILVACEEVGIAIGPLMGGAAVFGLAVAFGAQNLIRDYFYGFMILLENQYKLNDVIQIGSTSGQVERITLRVTVLRDGEGRVHFVPNGKIDSVTNMTHGWSRAMFDIGVAYKEDADRVMGVLLDLAKELRDDPEFGPSILDDAEMLGVDAFGDSSVTIKFFIKTRPLRQWAVKRELLRRIKRRFDELGIEIPYPHRTVFHRHEEPADDSGRFGKADDSRQSRDAA